MQCKIENAMMGRQNIEETPVQRTARLERETSERLHTQLRLVPNDDDHLSSIIVAYGCIGI